MAGQPVTIYDQYGKAISSQNALPVSLAGNNTIAAQDTLVSPAQTITIVNPGTWASTVTSTYPYVLAVKNAKRLQIAVYASAAYYTLGYFITDSSFVNPYTGVATTVPARNSATTIANIGSHYDGVLTATPVNAGDTIAVTIEPQQTPGATDSVTFIIRAVE